MTQNHPENMSYIREAFLSANLPPGYSFEDLATKPGLKLENGFSALSNFIWNDFLTPVGIRYLHKRGIDLHAVDNAGNIPLYYTVCENKSELFNLLFELDGHTHVNALQETRSDRKSLLHFAVAHKNMAIAKKLIAAGANVNAIDKDNHSPLAKAVINKDESMIRLLLKSGCDLAKYEDVTGIKLLSLMHPMILAEIAGEPEDRIVLLLLENGASPFGVNSQGEPLIAHYAERNRIDIVSALADVGAPLDKHGTGNNHQTALIHAVIHSNRDMIGTLLKAGADPNATTPYADLPLMYAIRREDWQSCDLLIEHGAKLDATRPNGATILCQAMISSLSTSFIEYILDAGANPNVMSFASDGRSLPLQIAARCQRLDCIELLLEYGANPLLTDIHGVMPLEYAMKTVGAGHPVTERLRRATKDAAMGNNLYTFKKPKNRRNNGIILP